MITIIMYFEYEKAILSTLSQCEIGVSTCVLEQGKYEDLTEQHKIPT